MSHISRSSAGSGAMRGHRGASFGGNNAIRHHPYDRSPPPRYSRSPPRARNSQRSRENVTMIPLARSISSEYRPMSWVEGDDMGTPHTRLTSSAARLPSWYEDDDMAEVSSSSTSAAARPTSWFQEDDAGSLSGPNTISDYMRGASWADMDMARHGSGGYSSSLSAGPGSTDPRSYGHHVESGYGRSRAHVSASTSSPAPRLSTREQEIRERYWNAEPAPSGHTADADRGHLEGPSGSCYAIPHRPVPGNAVSGYEAHMRQPEPGLDPPNSHWPATDGPGLVRRQAIRRPQPEAETVSPSPHWPATGGPGLVRRQAIRRPQPSEGMRRREEHHRRREESRRRRSSERLMSEGSSGASPCEMSRPRPQKRVRFATEVERFSRGW